MAHKAKTAMLWRISQTLANLTPDAGCTPSLGGREILPPFCREMAVLL